MNREELTARITDAVQRELIEIRHLALCERDDDFIQGVYQIQDDLDRMADLCNVWLQEYLSPPEQKSEHDTGR